MNKKPALSMENQSVRPEHKRLAYPGIFITGTDTGVGKTVISAALAQMLRLQGINVGVMKPIETGCRMRRGVLIPQDAHHLQKAAGASDSLDVINPYRFRLPLAPWPASLIEGKKIEMRAILSAYKRLRKAHDFIIVEGIGGLRVPLTATWEVIHLIKRLGLPVLLVARSGLGTLNHTLLTLDYGKAQGVLFLGVLLNGVELGKTPADKTNRQVLEKKISLPVMGPFPHIQHGQNGEMPKRSSALWDLWALLGSSGAKAKQRRLTQAESWPRFS